MSLLTLDISKCVRTTNKFSTCTDCVDVCPVETIKIDEHLPSFVPNDCVGCGGCLAACPDAAYSLDDFSAINYIFSYLENENDVITCKETIPCMAALNVDEMLSMLLLQQRDVIYDMSHCEGCSIANVNKPIIESRVEEVNFLLEAMDIELKIHLDKSKKEIEETSESVSTRRDFFAKANIKDVTQAKVKLENSVEALDEELREHVATNDDIQSIRQKSVPDRRKLLSMAMKRANVPETFHVLSTDDVSFSSQKVLDEESCTNCQMCYRICPTGALSSNNYGEFIAFDAFACIKCASCHDVCEPKSLTIKPTFSLEKIFKPEKETLVKFDLKRCNECGMPFIYRGGEMMCTRCRIEEEEANELWRIK